MHKSSLDYLQCVKCHSKLKLDSFIEDEQIVEGVLTCTKCGLVCPIIDSVAVLWNDFSNYLKNRPRLGGELLLATKSEQLKSIVKNALANPKPQNDASILEKNWAGIYQSNKNAEFYQTIKKSIENCTDIALEHGCSIGIMTEHLAQKSNRAFGIDKSFYAIRSAMNLGLQNADFFVADSMEHPFGKTQFDLVVGLNLFELVEPKKLLEMLAAQTKKTGMLILSDPYDYERGENSVKNPLYEDELRITLKNLGFSISDKTKNPSHITWNLVLHERANLQYLVDFIVATKN